MSTQHFFSGQRKQPGYQGHSGRLGHSEHDPGFILVAVTDAGVRAEATHVVAATGREVLTAEDPRDIPHLAPRAAAVVVDKQTAAHVASVGRTERIYFVAADAETIDFEAAMKGHAQEAYLLPAEAEDFLQELGSWSSASAVGRSPSTRPERNPSGGARDTAQAAQAFSPPRPPAGETGVVIAVMGACGGAGASTLAAAAARCAARQGAGGSVTLVDAVPNSGGLDLLLGLEYAPGARWPDLGVSAGSGEEWDREISAGDVRAALPATADGVAVLSAARPSGAVADSFHLQPGAVDAVTASLSTGGLTVLDMAPPGLATEKHVLPAACQHVVVVTATEVRSTARAAQLIAELNSQKVPTSLVVRQRQWSGLSVKDVEELVRADAVAVVPHLRRLPKTVETYGLPDRLPRGLDAAARRVLETVGWAA